MDYIEISVTVDGSIGAPVPDEAHRYVHHDVLEVGPVEHPDRVPRRGVVHGVLDAPERRLQGAVAACGGIVVHVEGLRPLIRLLARPGIEEDVIGDIVPGAGGVQGGVVGA